MGSYLHGTRGFAHQIFLNHKIGSYIETNKRDIFESISHYPMKNLVFVMDNTFTSDLRKNHFKHVDFTKIPDNHQQLLIKEGYDSTNQIKESNLLRIRATGKFRNYLKLISYLVP